MNGLQKVQYGQGAQTLRLTPIDAAGRPARVTSASYSIVDVRELETSSDRVIASGSATLSAVDTTLSAAGGAGTANPRQLTLASATGVSVGQRLLATTAEGRTLLVVERISGSAITVRDQVPLALPSGTPIQALDLEASFPSDEANDQDALREGREYQCTWTYALQGETIRVAQAVWLVRYTGEAWITEDDVVRAYPSLPDRVRGKVRIVDAITVATQDLIAELEAAGRRAEGYRTGLPGLVAVRNRAIAYCLRWVGSGDTDASYADVCDERYTRLRDNLITGRPGTASDMDPVDDVRRSAVIDGMFEAP